jgi:hypothetical protein
VTAHSAPSFKSASRRRAPTAVFVQRASVLADSAPSVGTQPQLLHDGVGHLWMK